MHTYENLSELYAAAARERDELRAALDGARLAMKALNEKLVQITAERDAMRKRLVEEDELCGLCARDGEHLPCWELVEALECQDCGMEKGICCLCLEGARFVFR